MTTKLSRRSAIAALASTTAATATGGAQAFPAGLDPVFAAIEAYEAAVRVMEAADDATNELEERLPRQSWSWGVYNETVPEGCTDDPQWVEAQLAAGRAHRAQIRVLTDLLLIAPTTIAGAAALLDYLGVESWEPPANRLEYFGGYNDDGVKQAATTFFPRLATTLRKLASAEVAS